MLSRSFNSKILLFGEYSVIKKSMALCTPYSLFEGSLAYSRQKQKSTDPELKALCQHIKKMESHGQLDFKFDVASFQFDIGQGLFFDSSIPQGFGVGSSGALVAALYERYGVPLKDNNEPIGRLKEIFAGIEAHFHGSSSGIDPLISYLNQSILIDDQQDLSPVEVPESMEGRAGIFLLNTGRSRKTEPLVNLFLEKCKDPYFDTNCVDKLIPITHSCIEHFLDKEWIELYQSFRELSSFQFEHFTPMIPTLFRDIWGQGLVSGDYYLKLCGAGGGGFLLGMTFDLGKVSAVLSQYELRPLYRW